VEILRSLSIRVGVYENYGLDGGDRNMGSDDYKKIRKKRLTISSLSSLHLDSTH